MLDRCKIQRNHTGQETVRTENSCQAISEKGNYCTKDKSHTGSHVACSCRDHNIDIWVD